MKKGVIICTIILFVLLTSIAYSLPGSCLITAKEGELIQLAPAAFDPDSDIGPAGRLIWTFYNPFNASGAWQTQKGQRGIYDFKLTVTDGEFTDLKRECVELLYNNKNPKLTIGNDLYLTIGESASVSALCLDPDEDPVSITYQLNNADLYGPVFYDEIGTHKLRITCEDNYGGYDSKESNLHILPAKTKKPVKEIITYENIPTNFTGIKVILPGDDIEVKYSKPAYKYPKSKKFFIKYEKEEVKASPEECYCNGDNSKIFLDQSCCVYAKVGQPIEYFEKQTRTFIITN